MYSASGTTVSLGDVNRATRAVERRPRPSSVIDRLADMENEADFHTAYHSDELEARLRTIERRLDDVETLLGTRPPDPSPRNG